MSTDRIPGYAGYVSLKTMPRGPRGFPLCRECRGETAGKTRTFCSEECVHAWKCRTQPGYQAEHVLLRDQGICALCRRDCVALHQALTALKDRLRADYREGHDVWANVMKWLGLRWEIWRGKLPRVWHVDHVVPVVEGGGGCGLENLRTLCLWCHRVETAALRKRMAEKRRVTP